jgi:hypothetical protein
LSTVPCIQQQQQQQQQGGVSGGKKGLGVSSARVGIVVVAYDSSEE